MHKEVQVTLHRLVYTTFLSDILIAFEEVSIEILQGGLEAASHKKARRSGNCAAGSRKNGIIEGDPRRAWRWGRRFARMALGGEGLLAWRWGAKVCSHGAGGRRFARIIAEGEGLSRGQR